MSSTFEQLLALFESVNRFSRQGERAPHKPLVMLYALRELQRQRTTIRFLETEAAVAPILGKFWAPDGSHRVEQPFVRLEADGFWQLGFPRSAAETPSRTISAAWLRKHDASAGFDAETIVTLQADPRRIRWAASILLLDACSAAEPFEVAQSLDLVLGD